MTVLVQNKILQISNALGWHNLELTVFPPPFPLDGTERETLRDVRLYIRVHKQLEVLHVQFIDKIIYFVFQFIDK